MEVVTYYVQCNTVLSRLLRMYIMPEEGIIAI